ncbi:MAG: 16S rRNA (guanine(966)-N(2))-methyltransferase RsmD [Bacillota bacterium]|nr:16S rRNA (guanine(966)-N(2))-methyltransferase RsmD [Bacillota bacterium]
MRVISGSCKGRILKSPRGKNTRPTSDKVKGAFFNILSDYVHKSGFLDLFAGTGSIGIEALSRGAEKCVFVENDPQSVTIIKANLNLTGMHEQGEILACNVNRGLKILAKKKESFDIVYLDPPYKCQEISVILNFIYENQLIVNGGIVGIERDSRFLNTLPETNPFRLLQKKVYGNTELIILKRSDIFHPN